MRHGYASHGRSPAQFAVVIQAPQHKIRTFGSAWSARHLAAAQGSVASTAQKRQEHVDSIRARSSRHRSASDSGVSG